MARLCLVEQDNFSSIFVRSLSLYSLKLPFGVVLHADGADHQDYYLEHHFNVSSFCVENILLYNF